MQKKKKKVLKRTYRRVGSLHRDTQGEEEHRHGDLQVFIHLGIKAGSACVNTHKVCGSLFACHSPASPQRTCFQRNSNNNKKTSCCLLHGVSAVVALAEAPRVPGSGTVRLCSPPLTFSLLDLQTCPADLLSIPSAH